MQKIKTSGWTILAVVGEERGANSASPKSTDGPCTLDHGVRIESLKGFFRGSGGSSKNEAEARDGRISLRGVECLVLAPCVDFGDTKARGTNKT